MTHEEEFTSVPKGTPVTVFIAIFSSLATTR